MADIDTSQNRDPSPTSDDLLAIRDRMMARLEDDGRVRDFGRPVRIIRSANLLTVRWRRDADTRSYRRKGTNWLRPDRWGGEAFRCRRLAETGEHLGLDRVGLILEQKP